MVARRIREKEGKRKEGGGKNLRGQFKRLPNRFVATK